MDEYFISAIPPLVAARVSGYGTYHYDKGKNLFPNELNAANVTVLSNSNCGDYEPHEITENMLCAVSHNAEDTCQGDSGGPLEALTYYSKGLREQLCFPFSVRGIRPWVQRTFEPHLFLFI